VKLFLENCPRPPFRYSNFEFTEITVHYLVDKKLIPDSGLAYGALFHYFLSERLSVGFNFGAQRSKLKVGILSGGKRDVADLIIDNYHGVVTYNFGDEDE
jgi:hypothetical protein